MDIDEIKKQVKTGRQLHAARFIKTSKMKNFKQVSEEFDKRVAEVGHGADFTKGEDGKVSEFGYKTVREDEIFTVTDFGNIKAFLKQTLKDFAEEICPKVDANNYQSEGFKLARQGFNQAIDEIRANVERFLNEINN